ncbi:hypothetical protein GRS96_07440 [Rathayibacter sp. VKM Ac-2803]|uniref:cell wall-binding repeat-containing protein n=1 Tax=Rathayibacter sp. VKM Ac-2803 TaxID=2609256 RepID=UPI0013589E6C|nr:cell wall-binding repeat-containing protein [Rathayibacter sp. VKM Ac-2803]MWV49109.1 hypothetical protein [Rathayibacter sp. VKM Ac-2803]
MSQLSLRSAAAAVLALVLAVSASPAASAEPLPEAPVVASADELSAPAQAIVPAGEHAWEPSATTPLPDSPPSAAARTQAEASSLASATASITGTVLLEEADGSFTTTLPRDTFLSVEVWTAADGAVGTYEVANDLTFTAGGLTAGRTYFLLVRDNYPTYASLWYGGSAIAVGAQPLEAPASGIELRTSRLGTLSGTVGGLSGDRRVDLWYREPSNGAFYRTDSQDLRVYGGDPYSFPSVVAGEYLVRASTQYGVVDDTYWEHVRRSGDASTVAVAIGGSTGGIDLELDDDYLWYTGRLAGSDRYATSVAATSAVFSPGIPVLYLASGAKWPDALSAAPAAAAQGGALLLTDPDRLPAVVADEIRRLDPARVIVVGSDLSVGPGVLGAVRSLVSDTTRIGGSDRYDTSRRVVADAFGTGPYDEVFLATGTNFPDALSAAPIAGWRGEPVLLVDGATSTVDTPTEAALQDLDPGHAEFIGGGPSISEAYQDDFTRRGLAETVSRIAGSNRHDTSVRLNRAYPQSLLQDTVFFAAGDSFADALSGATSAAALGSSVLLTERDCVHDYTTDFMATNSKNYAFLLGGEPTLTRDVENLVVCEYR